MTGAEMIAVERRRQVEAEGWTSEHDDEHDTAELIEASLAYAVATMGMVVEDNLGSAMPAPPMWPWDAASWRPSDDPVRNLVKAGALLAAEIDRLRRRSGAAAGSDNLVAFNRRRTLGMNIVNQLFDLAGVPVDVRQSVNDQADDFVFMMLSKLVNGADGSARKGDE